MNKYKPIINYSLLIVGLIFAAFVSFWNLDFLPIRIFDESRNAVNAIEMFQSNNFLYTTYEFEPETWNTKPPLLIWLQVISLHIFGAGEFAIRFPTALAGLGIAILLFWYSKKTTSSYLVGFIATICLFSSMGFAGIHALRTGDFDIPLSFFLLGFILHFLEFIKSDFQKIKSLRISVFFLIGAFLTKGISFAFFIPGIALFLFLDKKLLKLIHMTFFWKYLGIVTFVIIAYYGIREIITPGYIQLVWDNELFGRYMVVNEGNSGGISFYLDILSSRPFGKKLLLLGFLSIPLAFYHKKNLQSITYYVSILIIFIIVISLSKTKLPWYLVPAYPIISILIAYTIIQSGDIVEKFTKSKIAKLTLIGSLSVFILLNKGKSVVADRLNPTDPQPEKFAYTELLKKSIDSKDSSIFNSLYSYVDFEHYKAHYLFYSHILGIYPKFENINNLQVTQEQKIVSILDEINQYLDGDITNVIRKEQVDGLTYYELGRKEEPETSAFYNSDISFYKNGLNFYISSKSPTDILVIKDSKISIPNTAYFYYFYCEYEEYNNYEVVRQTGWDYENYNGLDLKFVKLRGKPIFVEFGEQNAYGVELWKEKMAFK